MKEKLLIRFFTFRRAGVNLVVLTKGKEAVVGNSQNLAKFFGEGCMNGHSLITGDEESLITSISKSAMLAVLHISPN